MSVLNNTINKAMQMPGTLACAAVDIETGQCLAHAGDSMEEMLEAAGVVNARMLRAEQSMAADQYKGSVEDVVITLNRQYHLIRLVQTAHASATTFLYVVMDRTIANLAIARRELEMLAQEMTRSTPIRFTTSDKVHGNAGIEIFSESEDEDELPPFMRNDVAYKLLGIVPEEMSASIYA